MNTTKRRTIRGVAALAIATTAALGLTACGDRDARDCHPAKASVAAAGKIAPAPIVVRPPAPRPPVVVRPPAPKPVQPAPMPAPRDSGTSTSSPWFWIPLFGGAASGGRGC